MAKFWVNFHTIVGDTDVTDQNVLLGTPIRAGMLSAQMLYILILLAKSYIWKCKQLNLIPNMNGFTNRTLTYITIERYIAYMTGKTQEFHQKLSKLIEILKKSKHPN